MGQSGGSAGRSSRCIALVGPYLSGKTTLLEAILARTGAVTRQGKVADKNTVGDASAEARDHGMSVELNVADVSFLGDTFTFIDCPGSIEFQHEGALALTGCDAAVVVCEPDPKRVPALQLILKQLEDRGIPRFLFLNKIDSFDTQVRDILPDPAAGELQAAGAAADPDLGERRRLRLRRPGARARLRLPQAGQSEVVEMPATVKERETEARFKMLEQLADYDDELMEQLLSDVQPPRDKVFADLVKELQDGLIVPVLLGSAENGNGILRLLKALRHEAPFVDRTARRLKLENAKSAAPRAQDHLHPARRQALDRARAGGRVRRRHDRAGRQVRGARGGRILAAGPGRQEARARQGRRHGGARAAGEDLLRRDAVGGEGRRHADQGARAAAAGLRRRHRRQGPQGRGEADRRARPG